MTYKIEGSERVDLQRLREDIRAVQRRLVALGSGLAEESIKESPNGVLMSCSGGQHQWTGSTTAEYAGPLNQEDYYALVDAEFGGSGRFTLTRQLSPDGADEWLIVRGDDGTRYSITVWTEDSMVQVSSSSWCFTLQPGQTDGGEF